MKSKLILHKLALKHLLNLSLVLAKLRKIELFRSLVLLTSSRNAAGRSAHRLEYQFSASSTPLIHRYYYNKSGKERILRRFYSFLFPCIYLKVGRSSKWDDEESSVDLVFERNATMMMLASCEESEANEGWLTEHCDYGGGFDDCVDEKAERFIAKFYEEIRKQRRESAGSCSD
ncbi:hypothetical protein QQ045_020931 [Rhodiola kirilowii]